MTYEEALLYVRNAQAIIDMFGEQPFRDAIAGFDMKDFTTTEICSAPATWHRDKGYAVIAENFTHEFEEYKGEWMRKVQKPAVKFLVPSPYQLRESDLIRAILHKEYPYTKQFPLDVYHMEKPYECYLRTDAGSLYIPYEAIVKWDYSIVEKRHTEYHKWYFNTPDRRHFLERALSVLDTWQAKLFKAAMEVCK